VSLLDLPVVYRVWQAPFAARKLAPVVAHNDFRAVRRVLDVGCGPGTNVEHFAGTPYLGLDLSRRYVADARRRSGRSVAAADARHLPVARGRFDFVLVNSMLHHVDTPGVHAILQDLARVLSPDGHVHVLDLVLPERVSVARVLARLDRGKHARPLEVWRDLFRRHFDPVVFEPYDLTLAGVPCWRMVYFKGRARTP
jgi:SAM-dependent methyltransferase